jgi:hypothetical protein
MAFLKPLQSGKERLMYSESLVFAQLMDFLPRHEFNKCVKRYQGDYRVNNFSCRDQFLCMAFAQLTYRESLRDIEVCLRALQPKLYHAGFRSMVARNTLANANRQRDWRIYADFAQVLIAHARTLYLHDDIGFKFEQTAYAFDSTTIDLCLSLFPWAKFRRRKGAVKLHTLIDLRGNIPCVIHFSTGKVHDVNALDYLTLEPGAFYMLDRGYVDYARLYRFTVEMAFFVTRAKSNMKYKRQKMRRVDKSTGLRSDYRIVLSGSQAELDYPVPLRRVAYYDVEHKKRLVFLTNNWNLPALTIARLYKRRWQVELFFKWIKQHLRIKAFYGTSPNAVQTQIWIAVCVYVLVAIVKKELRLECSMYQILQILSISLGCNRPSAQAEVANCKGFA